MTKIIITQLLYDIKKKSHQFIFSLQYEKKIQQEKRKKKLKRKK
jgi:hypothetical protein